MTPIMWPIHGIEGFNSGGSRGSSLGVIRKLARSRAAVADPRMSDMLIVDPRSGAAFESAIAMESRVYVFRVVLLIS
jgi:hypothetical protein